MLIVQNGKVSSAIVKEILSRCVWLMGNAFEIYYRAINKHSSHKKKWIESFSFLKDK